MIATKEYIQQQFCEFNRLLFGGQLPLLPIRMGKARTMLGAIHYFKRKAVDGRVEYENVHLTISSCFDLPETEIQDVLIHEMIHYYILHHRIVDTSPHGQVFCKIMEEINRKYGRHITISRRGTPETRGSASAIRQYYVALSHLKDGRVGVTVAAKTRLFDLWRRLPLDFPVQQITWYVTTSPYFSRFPAALKPKIYLVKDVEELQQAMAGALELVKEGNTIRPVVR